MADDGGEQVVEIVGDAARKLADRLQLLALHGFLAAKRRGPGLDRGHDEIAAVRRGKDAQADTAATGALEHGLQLNGAVRAAAALAKAGDPVANVLRGGIGDEQCERLAAKLGIGMLDGIAQKQRAEGIVRGQDHALAAGQRHRLRRAREQCLEGFVEASGRRRGRHEAEAGIARAAEVNEA